MTDPGLRDLVLAEGRKQARIHGVDMECAEVYADGWAAALYAAQPAVAERERELSLARRELERLRVEVSNAHYWRDTARADRDVAQRELAGAKERIKIRDETIRDLREDIAKLRELAHDRRAESAFGEWADVEEIWPSEILAVLDGEGEKPGATGGVVESGQIYQVGESGCSSPHMPLPKGGEPTGRKVTIHVRDSDGVERQLVDKLWKRDWDSPEDAVYDKPAEHFELSREEWNAAANKRLDELGVTYSELAAMNRDGNFRTHQHQVLWVLIGGTLDADESGRNDVPVSSLSRPIPEPTGNNSQENADG